MRIYRKQRTLWRIGLFPLVDVVVLFFAALQIANGPIASSAVTTTFALKPKEQIASQGIPVTITVESDGVIYLDGIPMDAADLDARLSDALRISGGGHLTIEPAPDADISTISRAVKSAQTSGATSLSLVVQNTGLPN